MYSRLYLSLPPIETSISNPLPSRALSIYVVVVPAPTPEALSARLPHREPVATMRRIALSVRSICTTHLPNSCLHGGVRSATFSPPWWPSPHPDARGEMEKGSYRTDTQRGPKHGRSRLCYAANHRYLFAQRICRIRRMELTYVRTSTVMHKLPLELGSYRPSRTYPRNHET